MRTGRVWARLLGLGAAVVEEVNFGAVGELVVAARPRWHERDRCGVCRRRSPGFDLGEGRRRWRALDLGTTPAFVEADAPRVCCREHGVVVCAMPWARHASRYTRAFEDQAAWLAVQCSRKGRRRADADRVAHGRVDLRTRRGRDRHDVDLLAGLRWIGIDEISHRKGQRYLTVVVDHFTGRLVWASAGRDRKTVEAFLDALGRERREQIELVSADMAAWISGPICRPPTPRRERWSPSRTQLGTSPFTGRVAPARRARGRGMPNAPSSISTTNRGQGRRASCAPLGRRVTTRALLTSTCAALATRNWVSCAAAIVHHASEEQAATTA